MKFLLRLVSDNSRSLEKYQLRRYFPLPHLKKNFCTESEFLLIDVSLDLTFLAPLTLEIWTVSQIGGPEPLLGITLERIRWYRLILQV